MSASWTDSLNPALRRGLDGRSWQRIEQARDGRWLALPDDAGRDGVAWHVLDLEAGTQTPLHPFEDTTLKGLAPAVSNALHNGATIQLLAHKVARRAVLKVHRGDVTRLVKVYRKDRSLHSRWHSITPVDGLPWRTPRVLDWDPDRRILETEWCQGLSLNQRWKAGSVEPADGERMTQVLKLLASQSIPDGFPGWTPADEARLLQNRLTEFEHVLEHPPEAAGSLVQRVIESLHGLPADSCFCHRDFHDKQILVEQDGGGSLIDLDLVARGPVGLDAGNMLAHMRLRALQGMPLGWKRLVEPLVGQGHAHGHGATLPVWTAATLTRLALLYCRRRHAPGLPAQLLQSAADARERTGEWREVFH